MNRIAPPYTAINKPTEQYVNYNDAKFYTELWNIHQTVELKGRILFLHGFSECSKLYIRLFDQLCQAGYEVFSIDQRGAGLTSPGKLKGITDEFHSFDDLDFFLKRTLDELSTRENKKLYLMGHSMGGGIALNYGIKGKYKDYLNGIALTGPLVQLNPSTRPGTVLYTISHTALKFFPNYRMDTKLNEEYITSDPEWRKYVNQEPVLPYLGSLRQLSDFIDRGENLLKGDYAKDFSVPLLILHGKQDQINDHDASKKFVEIIPIPDKKFISVKDGRHSIALEREPIYEFTRDSILEWLAKH